MRSAALCMVALLACATAGAQEFTPPPHTFRHASDYDRYEKDIRACIAWIESTPPDGKAAQRKEAAAFLIEWLAGHPTLHIEINEKVVEFVNSAPELLPVFLGGWTLYSLDTGRSDLLGGNTAGIEAVIRYYRAHRMERNRQVEHLIRLQRKGLLKRYVARCL